MLDKHGIGVQLRDISNSHSAHPTRTTTAKVTGECISLRPVQRHALISPIGQIRGFVDIHRNEIIASERMGWVLAISFGLGKVNTIPKMRNLPRSRIRKIENPSALHIHWVTVNVIPKTVIDDQPISARRIGLLPCSLSGNRLWRSKGQAHNHR
ncbi:hypothetical protein JF69_03080 [Bifidobacterium kimbladii]|uniref:Uncharacterized protein n=1 Tax=Bifidobacterium asteroides TaxID=1684 RepID=A0A0F4L1S4_9BIFI|nr:hypothetical protein JF69_03080 [Bifidobacterium asteroides]